MLDRNADGCGLAGSLGVLAAVEPGAVGALVH
jgi:hypothetical protein